MKKLSAIMVILLLVCHLQAQQTFKQNTMLMGCQFDITVVAQSEEKAEGYIHLAIEEIQRIERLISSWESGSETSQINLHAGVRPVKVSNELMALIKRSLALSQLTDGAFDISYASMDKIWRFDGSMVKLPPAELVKASVARVNHHDVILNEKEQTVFLKHRGMKIGFGAIGKGYAADKAKALLISQGVKAGIINASGDLSAWGTQADGKAWKVAITNPMNKSRAFAMLPVQNAAVVTSGDYERFVEIEGIKYAHIIDPRTGYPSRGIVSVTVCAPKAELADALATSVFVMGIEAGLHRINQFPNVECIVIDDKGGINTSENIKIDKS